MALELICDLNGAAQALHHPWRTCVGSGHATLALRADWQAQLRTARAELGFEYVRFHGLLDDDMGTLVDESDVLLYSFFNADQIVDFLVDIGMRPIVELSFMPLALSSGGDIVFHYKGNITPPRDMAQWAELMRKLAAHWVERYGIEEVAQWYFEVWNEPNLPAFWTGTQEQYFALYAASVQAIKRVDARLRVGGPATAGNAWIPEFQQYCAAHQLPADFISTHYYPTDAFGQIDSDTTTQLEHAPRDVMRTHAQTAREQAAGKPLLYTEWNITSNPRDPLHDGSAAAALATRIVMSVDDVVDAYSYWTFTDIFEENYFPSVPFHGGFGLMNLHGVRKPIYHAFAFVARLGKQHVPVVQDHATVMAWIGGLDDARTSSHVLAINQAMPRHAIDDEPVAFRLTAPHGMRAASVTIARIDATHANPVALWQSWHSPNYLSRAQVAALHVASTPPVDPLSFHMDGPVLLVATTLAPQSANLLRIEWVAA
ncbi:MAG: cellulase family glycosylhydrolase [Pseudomonadota bacterium]|nr:cellulase family glycosylhydrolase [Pseudomonadota bacterium]